jgi:hypothetical protein
MNSVSIELNNRAVAYLQSGNSVKAFELLSTNAYNIALQVVTTTNHTHVDSDISTFRFQWEDCSKPGISNKPTSSTWEEGSATFLFLRGLRVSVSNDVGVDEELCTCGYAWVIWYNLALCCSVIGTRLGERGQKLLETAIDLYCRVQRQIDKEPSSKHWDLLRMAVMNNQACIYHGFGMRVKTRECLEQLAFIVLKSSNGKREDKTRTFFAVNLQILGTYCVASAA